MKKAICGSLSVGAISLLAACSGAEPGAPAQGEPSDVAEANSAGRVLHEFQAGEEVVSFVEYEDESGGSTVMLGEEYSAFAKSTLSDRALEAAGEPLTMLEMFYALAPEGEVPDAALVEAHEAETAELGRVSDEVINVGIDVTAPVEKSAASCEAFIYDLSGQIAGSYYGSRGTMDNASGSNYLCLYGMCSYYTTSYTRSGACNESNVTMSARGVWGYQSVNNGAWVYSGWVSMAPYTAYRWSMQSGSARRMAVVAYSSGTYRLRTGAVWISH